MIKLENPKYMTCKEIGKVYPNYMVCIGKYRDLNETNGNDGGYPFALIEEDELGTGAVKLEDYKEWHPILKLSTFPEDDFFVFDFEDEIEVANYVE
ncbi:MAG: hypothetical protein FWG64_06360 [Firmicutes bacterium]|nr:hypothetical protein [Bacillota bacterium]